MNVHVRHEQHFSKTKRGRSHSQHKEKGCVCGRNGVLSDLFVVTLRPSVATVAVAAVVELVAEGGTSAESEAAPLCTHKQVLLDTVVALAAAGWRTEVRPEQDSRTQAGRWQEGMLLSSTVSVGVDVGIGSVAIAVVVAVVGVLVSHACCCSKAWGCPCGRGLVGATQAHA